MPDVHIEFTKTFWNLQTAKQPINLFKGGARSGKSYGILQWLICIVLQQQKNKSILVTRKSLPSLKQTAYRWFVDILKHYHLYDKCIHNKTDNVIRYNDHYILFSSIDDPIKIKSTEWNYIFMEEGNEFTYEDYMTLKLRRSGKKEANEQNKLILAYNPTDAHGWIQSRVLGKEGVELFHSTYLDNPFLPGDYVRELERLKNEDEAYWKIYGLGEYAQLENIIYKPFEILNSYPDSFDDSIYGLDFGFNSPTALVEIGLKDDELYTKELLYQTKLTNADLIDILKDLIPEGRRVKEIYGDSEAPDRIEEIKRAGFNIKPAYKGKGSVKDGIDFCKRKKIYSLVANTNLNNERAAYKWKEDKDGNVLDEPVKFNDHGLDALRYGIYTHLGKKKFVGVEIIEL